MWSIKTCSRSNKAFLIAAYESRQLATLHVHTHTWFYQWQTRNCLAPFPGPLVLDGTGRYSRQITNIGLGSGADRATWSNSYQSGSCRTRKGPGRIQNSHMLQKERGRDCKKGERSCAGVGGKRIRDYGWRVIGKYSAKLRCIPPKTAIYQSFITLLTR